MEEKDKELLFKSPSLRALIDKIELDGVNGEYHGLDYEVSYDILDEENNRQARCVEYACFGTLGAHLTEALESANPPHILHFKPHKFGSQDDLTQQEKIDWAQLGIDIGLLDGKQSAEEIISKGLRVYLQGGNALVVPVYMKLCWIRWIREAQGIVHYTLRLVKEEGRDPWASIAYTHNHFAQYPDQSLLPFAGPYGGYGYSEKANAFLGFPLRLKELCYHPEDIDTRKLVECISEDEYEDEEGIKWNWHYEMVKPPQNLELKNNSMLLADDLLPVYAFSKFSQALKMLESIKKACKVDLFAA